MPTLPKVGIVYLSYNSEVYLDDLVSSLKKMSYPKDRVELIIVDNPHPTFGPSVRSIEEIVMPLAGTVLPHVTLLPQEKNLGFSGGNNIGIQSALDMGCDYVFLHNNDGFGDVNCVMKIVEAMEVDKTIGAAQSLVLLYPETDLVNSSGNSLQYLGVGYCNNFRIPRANLTLAPVTETNYASGAAIMMRADVIKKCGLWDEDYFMYHEDVEYSWRLRIAGYRIVVVRDSLFFHKYSFGRNKIKFYCIERNRLGFLLSFFRWPTLILMLPMAIVWELGVLVFAAQGGWLKEKLATYVYWLKIRTWKLWLGKRARLQKMRVVPDRRLLAATVNTVHFMEKSINVPLLRYVANPLLTMYGTILKAIVFW